MYSAKHVRWEKCERIYEDVELIQAHDEDEGIRSYIEIYPSGNIYLNKFL
jgi:hypothetical protein